MKIDMIDMINMLKRLQKTARTGMRESDKTSACKLSCCSAAGPLRRASFRPAIILCLLLLLPVSGCGLPGGLALAREELPSAEDRLIGIFVTEDYIEPASPTLRYNRLGNITVENPEPDRIYGSYTASDDASQSVVTFPALEGLGLYQLTVPGSDAVFTTADPGFSDLHFEVTDDGDYMEGSLYVVADQPQLYYFHPVYQQADGQIYLLPGSGISSDALAEGAQFNQTISESSSQTENGTVVAQGQSFSVNVIAKNAPLDTELLCMDREHQVLQRIPLTGLETLSGTAPADSLVLETGSESNIVLSDDQPRLTLPADTAYVILCQTTKTGQDSHSAYDYGCEYLEYYMDGKNGILYPYQIQLVWPQSR